MTMIFARDAGISECFWLDIPWTTMSGLFRILRNMNKAIKPEHTDSMNLLLLEKHVLVQEAGMNRQSNESLIFISVIIPIYHSCYQIIKFSFTLNHIIAQSIGLLRHTAV